MIVVVMILLHCQLWERQLSFSPQLVLELAEREKDYPAQSRLGRERVFEKTEISSSYSEGYTKQAVD